jgi:hypothetical protein
MLLSREEKNGLASTMRLPTTTTTILLLVKESVSAQSR